MGAGASVSQDDAAAMRLFQTMKSAYGNVSGVSHGAHEGLEVAQLALFREYLQRMEDLSDKNAGTAGRPGTALSPPTHNIAANRPTTAFK